MIDSKVTGFVYQRVDFKENDVILSVLSKDSNVSFKARGILKPTSKNASGCNFFTISEFILTSKSEIANKTLRQASVKKIYKEPYENLLASGAFMFILNVISQISEHINAYDLAITCFDKLENKEYPINVLIYFLKEILNNLGYMPSINGCINCNKKDNLISFSLEDGGFICANCFDSNRHEHYQPKFLKCVYDFYKQGIDNFDNTSSLKLFKLYVDYFQNEVGIVLKGISFLYKCL